MHKPSLLIISYQTVQDWVESMEALISKLKQNFILSLFYQDILPWLSELAHQIPSHLQTGMIPKLYYLVMEAASCLNI